MKHNFTLNEVTISVILIILLILCLNPFDLFMPSSLVMMLLGLLVALFCIFVALIWREKPRDEREAFHRMLAGRVAFLTGSSILITGIIIQELAGTSDPWLIFALVAMILAKLFTFIYGQKKL